MEFRLAQTIGPAAKDKDFRGASEVVGCRSMHIKEILLSIVSAAILLRGGYYQVRWPAKAAEAYNHDRKYPLSEGHIRLMGWMMLPMGLVCLYAAVVWVIEALLNADFYISGAVLLVLLL